MKKRLLLLTGNPGVGKTTVLRKIVDSLKLKGFRVGGMLSQEVRAGNARTGFEIIDLSTGRKGWLAQVSQKAGPHVGKYAVNIGDLERVGVEAIMRGAEFSDVVAIDEIGPMELFSEKFRRAVMLAVESSKLVLAVVHENSRDSLLTRLQRMEDSELYVVTVANRENLPMRILETAFEFLSASG